MERFTRANNMAQLMDVVCAGNPNPESVKPLVRAVKLWDGRWVKGEYYHGPKEGKPDLDSYEDPLPPTSELEALLQRLLYEGTPFVIRMGESDDTCTLQWSLGNQ